MKKKPVVSLERLDPSKSVVCMKAENILTTPQETDRNIEDGYSVRPSARIAPEPIFKERIFESD